MFPNTKVKKLSEMMGFIGILTMLSLCQASRVSVQGVKSLGGHFACLCRGFEFYEVKRKLLLFFKKKMEILFHF